MKLFPVQPSSSRRHFDLSVIHFLSSIIALATAFPTNAASPQALTLALPTNLTLLNLTHITSPSPTKEWPPASFGVKLVSDNPKDFCILYFTDIGAEEGTPDETEGLLWEILEKIDMYKLLPKEDPAKGFDEVVKGVRFILEPVPQQWVLGDPLSVNLAFEALNQLYGLVLKNMAAELKALIECNGIALGRFRTWFDSKVDRVKHGG